MSARVYVTLAFLVVGGAVLGSRFFGGPTASSEPPNIADGPAEQTPQREEQSTGGRPLVFDRAEVDLGIVKDVVRHRFVIKNQGQGPLRINRVAPSCACAVTKPDVDVLDAGKSTFVDLEADITRKTPGRHRFGITVEYENQKPQVAHAAVIATYAPDLQVIPPFISISLAGGAAEPIRFSLVDFREKPLEVRQVRTSTGALRVKITDTPSQYMPGWRYSFEATYKKSEGASGGESGETIWIETSDPDHSILTVPVSVRRFERIRLMPQAVKLTPGEKGMSARVLIRDTEGEDLQIDTVDVPGGVVAVQFTREPQAFQHVVFTLAEIEAQPAGFPVTARVRLKTPCVTELTVVIALALPGG